MTNHDEGRSGTDTRNVIRSRVVEALEQLGYSRDQMAFQERFRLETEDGEILVPIEIMVSVDDRPALLIKCIDGHISTREQAAVALARLFPGGPVPFAMVANETDAVVVETGSRRTVGFGFSTVPTPSEIRSRFRNGPQTVPEPGSQEREKRILATYFHLRCPVPKDPY